VLVMSNAFALAFVALVPTSPEPFAGGGGLAKDPESVFKRLDVNGDGKITREEFSKLRDQLSDKAKATSRDEQLTAKLFGRMDENKDSYITFDEFKKFRGKFATLLKKRTDAKQGEISQDRFHPPEESGC
jgi:hypothetical protein